MPLHFTGFTSRQSLLHPEVPPLPRELKFGTVLKGEGAIHTEKWHRCWVKVQGQGHSSGSAAAICTASLGPEASLNAERKKKKKAFAGILKFDESKHPRNPKNAEGGGRFTKAPTTAEAEPKKKKKLVSSASLVRDEKSRNRSVREALAAYRANKAKESDDTEEKAAPSKMQQAANIIRDANKHKDKLKPETYSALLETAKSRIQTEEPEEHLTPDQQKMQNELEARAKKPVWKVKTPEEAVELVLKGENVEIEDAKSVHTVLKKLGEIAIAASKTDPPSKAPDFDPCGITVKGVSLFCTEKIKTDKFKHGIPRIEMPQFKSKNPVPGSEADKLVKVNGEVDATEVFLDHMTAIGVKTDKNGKMLARKLKASQAQMEGAKVAGMMLNPKFDPKKARITVSRDGYVVDGHHTWAAAIGRDAEDGNLDNDKEMDVAIIDLPMSEIYHLSVNWTKRFGLPAAGIKKRDWFDWLVRHAAH